MGSMSQDSDLLYKQDVIFNICPEEVYELEAGVGCVYIIENPKGKIYIGKSIDLRRRLIHYKNLVFKDRTLLYNSLKKYGFESHKIGVLFKSSLDDQLLEKEVHYIGKYKSNIVRYRKYAMGLNMTDGGDGTVGYKHTPESLKKMSDSVEGRGGFAGSKNPRYGKKVKEATKLLISKANTGRKLSEEARKKVGEASKKDWEKNREKRMASFTAERRAEMSRVRLGKTPSIETRRKMSQNSSRNKSKLVLDLCTGIYYYSCKEAAIALGHPQSTLRSRLNGAQVNNTSLKYI